MNNPITPLISSEVNVQETEVNQEGYFKRVLIAIDMFFNVLFGGNPSETISSRAARASTEGKTWGKILSSFLNMFESDHGAKAEVGDLQRAKDVISLEEKSGNIE